MPTPVTSGNPLTLSNHLDTRCRGRMDSPLPRGEHVAPRAQLSITGSRGIEEFDRRTLALVKSVKDGVTRTDLFTLGRGAELQRPNHHLSLRRHLSFSLTRLHGLQLVERTGQGGKHAPYRYYASTAQGLLHRP